MLKEELIPDTLGQLIEGGKVFTAPDGSKVIIGDTDTVAFQDGFGWQVAERVVWNNVTDVDFADDMLKRYARHWIHECGSKVRAGMIGEVAQHFSITWDEAKRVVEHIENAVVVID